LQVELSHISKRFRKEWVFKDLTHTLKPNDRVAILGSNGSGKSTLTQIIAGYISPTEGTIVWLDGQLRINREHIFRYVSICSPGIQLWDELTLKENVELFRQFKKITACADYREFARMIELEKHAHNTLKTYSSGMKQRVKLGLAILSDAKILILDEPCSHLDNAAVQWYQSLLRNNSSNKLVLVASNSDEREIFLCNERIDINQYRP
jgi:ABC-type multidrug transport system ATPase subunit